MRRLKAFAIILVLVISLSVFVACGDSKKSALPSNPNGASPMLIGVSVIADNPLATADGMATADNDADFKAKIEAEIAPCANSNIFSVSSLEPFYFVLTFDNKDNREITSVTINNQPYPSDLFVSGSTNQYVIIQQVEGHEGVNNYVVNSAKYLENGIEKDVLIATDPNVRIGVTPIIDNIIMAVGPMTIGASTVSFSTTVLDSNKLIGTTGYAKVALYDGNAIIATKNIKVSTDNVTFENLVPNTNYKVAIVVSYDGYSTSVQKISEIYSFSTDELLQYSNIKVGYNQISFDYSGGGDVEIKSQIILKGEQKFKDISVSERSATGLLANTSYTLKTIFENGDGKQQSITYQFKTKEVTRPTIEITNICAGSNKITFDINENDKDGVGYIDKVELSSGSQKFTKNGGSTRYEFDGLSAGTTYSITLTYLYNVYDGNGEQTITKMLGVTTQAANTPTVFISTITDVNIVTIYIQTENITSGDLTVDNYDMQMTKTGEYVITGLFADTQYTIKFEYYYETETEDGTLEKEITFKTLPDPNAHQDDPSEQKYLTSISGTEGFVEALFKASKGLNDSVAFDKNGNLAFKLALTVTLTHGNVVNPIDIDLQGYITSDIDTSYIYATIDNNGSIVNAYLPLGQDYFVLTIDNNNYKIASGLIEDGIIAEYYLMIHNTILTLRSFYGITSAFESANFDLNKFVSTICNFVLDGGTLYDVVSGINNQTVEQVLINIFGSQTQLENALDETVELDTILNKGGMGYFAEPVWKFGTATKQYSSYVRDNAYKAMNVYVTQSSLFDMIISSSLVDEVIFGFTTTNGTAGDYSKIGALDSVYLGISGMVDNKLCGIRIDINDISIKNNKNDLDTIPSITNYQDKISFTFETPISFPESFGESYVDEDTQETLFEINVGDGLAITNNTYPILTLPSIITLTIDGTIDLNSLFSSVVRINISDNAGTILTAQVGIIDTEDIAVDVKVASNYVPMLDDLFVIVSYLTDGMILYDNTNGWYMADAGLNNIIGTPLNYFVNNGEIRATANLGDILEYFLDSGSGGSSAADGELTEDDIEEFLLDTFTATDGGLIYLISKFNSFDIAGILTNLINKMIAPVSINASFDITTTATTFDNTLISNNAKSIDVMDIIEYLVTKTMNAVADASASSIASIVATLLNYDEDCNYYMDFGGATPVFKQNGAKTLIDDIVRGYDDNIVTSGDAPYAGQNKYLVKVVDNTVIVAFTKVDGSNKVVSYVVQYDSDAKRFKAVRQE